MWEEIERSVRERVMLIGIGEVREMDWRVVEGLVEEEEGEEVIGKEDELEGEMSGRDEVDGEEVWMEESLRFDIEGLNLNRCTSTSLSITFSSPPTPSSPKIWYSSFPLSQYSTALSWRWTQWGRSGVRSNVKGIVEGGADEWGDEDDDGRECNE
jgi:hypothetical protein